MKNQRGSKKRTRANTAVYPNSFVAVAARNLLNMTAVAAASATILLCLMMIRKF